MNGKDVKDLNVILERMDQADKDREKIHTDIKFIKENLTMLSEVQKISKTKNNNLFR